jgi:hypothetical protein
VYPLPYEGMKEGVLHVLRIPSEEKPFRKLVSIMILDKEDPAHIVQARNLKVAACTFEKEIGKLLPKCRYDCIGKPYHVFEFPAVGHSLSQLIGGVEWGAEKDLNSAQ